jgi:hypothetical protein
MATNSLFVENENKYTAEHIGSKLVKAEVDIDFSKHTIAGATDTIECLKIPKGAFVTSVTCYVKSVTTSAADVDTVGDGDDPNGWQDADIVLDSAAAVGLSLPGDAYPTLGGKVYTAADTIDVVLKTAVPSDGILTVSAVYSIIDAVANA